jgi:rSAM/selenodomain-associated transferase 2
MKIAVIIPTLNEAIALPQSLAAIGAGCDIVITDGGSSDATCAIAAQAGAHVLHGLPPRAHQLNCAAAQTSADILLFLHADTLLPSGWQEDILHILNQPGVAVGAFSLAIAQGSRAEAFIAYAANLRSRIWQLPYGDQGLFMYRTRFEKIGGFPDVPIMDDYIFIKTAQRHGRILTSKLSVTTSNRRWRRLGVWRTTVRNHLVVIGYHLKVNVDLLQRFYRR